MASILKWNNNNKGGPASGPLGPLTSEKSWLPWLGEHHVWLWSCSVQWRWWWLCKCLGWSVTLGYITLHIHSSAGYCGVTWLMLVMGRLAVWLLQLVQWSWGMERSGASVVDIKPKSSWTNNSMVWQPSWLVWLVNLFVYCALFCKYFSPFQNEHLEATVLQHIQAAA